MRALPDDEMLFEAIGRNDRQAFNLLFQKYYKSLVNFAFLYVKNVEEAEDVVSEVFLTLWKNRGQLMIRNVRPYIYTMTRHEAIRLVKSRQPLFEDIEDLLYAFDSKDPSYPGRALEVEEFQKQLQLAVSILPPRCRQIFELNRLDGLKYGEISDVLGISERTIEHHVAKAISVISDFLHSRQDGRNKTLTY